MKRLVLLSLVLAITVLAMGCGGMPKPKIDSPTPTTGTANVRLCVVPTNYTSDWDSEKVKLVLRQQWLTNDGVATNEDVVAEIPYAGPQAGTRGMLKLADARGNQTRDVNLAFQVKSGADPLNINVSADTQVRWGMGGYAEADTLLLIQISRVGNNTYNIDAAYAVDMANGQLQQLLPRNK